MLHQVFAPRTNASSTGKESSFYTAPEKTDSDCIFFSLTLEGMMVASTVYSLLTPSSEIVTVTLTESSFPNATPYTALCSSVFIVIEEKRRQQSESASTERMQATDSRAHKQKMGGPSRHTLVASLSSRAEDRGSVCTNKQTSVNTSNCFLYSHCERTHHLFAGQYCS